MKSQPFKGFYLVFEGGEGCGKTTQAQLLSERLRAEFPQREIILTREPGGTFIGDEIRAILLPHSPGEEEMEIITEAYLFAAARAESLRKEVRPALERGTVVIADRSVYSSLVYQGEAGGLGLEVVRKINEEAVGGILPDKVIFLDIEPELGLARRGEDLNRLDRKELSYHRRVREAYRQLAREDPTQFIIIDASPSIEVVQEIIWERLSLFVDNEIKRELKRGKERE
jgi:dTMP kinase